MSKPSEFEFQTGDIVASKSSLKIADEVWLGKVAYVFHNKKTAMPYAWVLWDGFDSGDYQKMSFNSLVLVKRHG